MTVTSRRKAGPLDASQDAATAAAWLSSVRAVGYFLKWNNERNPRPVLLVSPETAAVTTAEEGEDDVKSAWRLYPGPHTSYNGKNNGMPSRKAELILINLPSVQIAGCNCPHEVGIGSNRGSADRGEYVLRSCTHCPSSQRSRQGPRVRLWRTNAQVGDED